MKALSIKQPWAWLICNGYKSIENRDWNTNFRGPFLIHAGKKMDMDAHGLLVEEQREVWKKLPRWENFELGGIVGMATLDHVVHEKDANLLTARDKPWFFGEYGFVLENAKSLPFMPVRGLLSFFDVDYPLEKAA